MSDRYRHTALELTRSSLAAAGRLRLSVISDSMAPLVRRGDAVWVAPAEPAVLRHGDVIVVQREDELVTHRLVAVRDEMWFTKGDSVSSLDPPVNTDAILGRVVAVERDGTQIDLRGLRWTVVNRLLGLIGWWEVRLFEVGRQVKRRLLGTGRRPGVAVLSRLVAVPFRALRRLILR